MGTMVKFMLRVFYHNERETKKKYIYIYQLFQSTSHVARTDFHGVLKLPEATF